MDTTVWRCTEQFSYSFLVGLLEYLNAGGADRGLRRWRSVHGYKSVSSKYSYGQQRLH